MILTCRCGMEKTRVVRPGRDPEWVCICCDLDSVARPDCPHKESESANVPQPRVRSRT